MFLNDNKKRTSNQSVISNDSPIKCTYFKIKLTWYSIIKYILLCIWRKIYPYVIH